MCMAKNASVEINLYFHKIYVYSWTFHNINILNPGVWL